MKRGIFAGIALLVGAAAAFADPAPPSHGMVASAHPLATAAGLEMLRRGGDAVDAAVATAFALAVVEPYSSGIGGGGFALVLPAPQGKITALDFRERAPARATRDMFLVKGKVDSARSKVGALAAGVPGEVAGLWEMHRRWGRLPWAATLKPAIRYAREGFPVDRELAARIAFMSGCLGEFPASRVTFLTPEGKAPAAGEVLRQAALADTLDRISQEGAKGFYAGFIATAIEREMIRSNGLISRSDLAKYRVIERPPVSGTYRGYKVFSMPPPSSGGVHLLQMLKMLEEFDLASHGPGSPETLHLLAEVMRRAFADRAYFLGDPDFVEVPVARLLDPEYLKLRASTIRRDHASSSQVVVHGDLGGRQGPAAGTGAESAHTTHLSVVDGEGAAVSATLTINGSFGSCQVVPSTGILLNNEMDDFSAQPGVPNLYGLVGGEANAVEAGKTPLSSMTPTLVLKDGALKAVVGSPGGPRIITTVLQVLVDLIDFREDLASALAAPRVHQQWLPDALYVERGVDDGTVKKLEALGHKIEQGGTWSNAQGIRRRADGSWEGGSDPRGVGEARGL